MARTTDNATVRALKIIELLFCHVLNGLPNAVIAKTLGYTEASVCRDFSLLAQMGWVTKYTDGNYILSTKPVALMKYYDLYMNEYNSRGKDFQNSVAAQARQMMP